MLPLCFTWIFVACVIFCCEHTAETHHTRLAYSITSVTGYDYDDCCPITHTLSSLMPERSSVAKQIDSHFYQAPPMKAVNQPGDNPTDYHCTRAPRLYSDPPLDHLCILRI